MYSPISIITRRALKYKDFLAVFLVVFHLLSCPAGAGRRAKAAGLTRWGQPGRWNWFFFLLPDYFLLFTASSYFFAFLAFLIGGFFAGALALAFLMAACAAASRATGTRYGEQET